MDILKMRRGDHFYIRATYLSRFGKSGERLDVANAEPQFAPAPHNGQVAGMFPPVCLSPTFGSRQDRQLADALMVSDGLDTDASAPRGSAKFLVLTGGVIGAQGAASRCFLPLVLFSLRVSGV